MTAEQTFRKNSTCAYFSKGNQSVGMAGDSHVAGAYTLYETAIWLTYTLTERWGAGVETQKNVRGEIGGWGRVPFNETYAPSLSTIYDGA